MANGGRLAVHAIQLDSTSLWAMWVRPEWTSIVSSGRPVHPTMDVEWKLFFTKQLPPQLQLFIMEVFHYKLSVQSRLVTMTEPDKCPICG